METSNNPKKIKKISINFIDDDIVIYEDIKKLAEENGRSFSKQVIFLLKNINN